MPYKIVQTIEDGAPTLTIIPKFWENKGLLRWPPKNNANLLKLIKDERSKPGAGWITLECTLKRNNIRTYEEANAELFQMEQSADTDNQENETPNLPVSFDQPTNFNDFEAMADNLINFQPSASDAAETSIMQNEPILIVSSKNSDTMLTNQTLILNKLDLIIDNQKRFAHKLASLSVQVDEMQQRQCNVALLKDTPQEEKESFCLKPIETSEEFEIFELSLADKTQKKKITKLLSTLFSAKPGEGQTCCYKLIDILFTKEFLCQCSWSGGSKGENSKIPMKNFKNFRKFFFELISTWDPNFTDDKMLNFFKIILRNANKRRAMQGLRASAKRSRKSKKIAEPNAFEVNNDSDSNHEGNNDNITEEPLSEGQPIANDGNDGEPRAIDVDANETRRETSI